jgi:predicted N-acetyltransferase YhbS
MIQSPFTLRPISPADSEAAAVLIRDAFAAISPALVPPPSALGETALSVAAQIAAGGGAVAEASGALVGVVLWGERDRGLYLGRLSVADGWRRAGMARALVEHGIAFARASGQPRVHVGVRLVLHGNRRLFAGLGFCETLLHTHAGFTDPTWVEMEKPLI